MIPVPKETLVGGMTAIGGDRDSTPCQGGSGVSITGQGWVRSGEAVPEVMAKVAVPEGRDTKSSGSEIGVDDGVIEGVSVRVVNV